MKRYSFLNQEDINEALNQLRNVLLAAKDGEEVNQILNGIFTSDEMVKIGRRIIIAKCIKNNLTLEEITQLLHVGKNTITLVNKSMESYPLCFELIEERGKKVEKVYNKKKHHLTGGSELIFKKKSYSGFKRKDVKR